EIQKRPEFREQFFGSFEGLDAKEIWDGVSRHVHQDLSRGYEGLTSPDAVKVEMDAFHELDPSHDAEDFMTFWLRVELGLIDVITKHRET
ncbi:histidine phosphatase family protein, partial [Aerococcus sp. UMB9870]|nr:histidine phosphatase family protein [Aerococcus sp. UMB9870]